jgi:hypothetical protein
MKNTTIILALFSAVNILLSCKNGSTEVDVKTVLASGKIEVLNGKGEKDTINFDCVGCDSNIKDIAVLKKIIAESSLRAKNSLNYPLSFLPKSVKLTVIKEDSLYYFGNNKKIENVLLVLANYNYIAKNSYGNELEGESQNSFYLQNNKIASIEDKIKLPKLEFNPYVNRSLLCYGENNEYIDFTPTSDKSIIIQTNIGCVEEGSILQITLENNNEIVLESWNDFNCDGNSYYNWFSLAQIEKLKGQKIKYLYFYSKGESILVTVPKNESDYIQQLIKLYK